MIKYRLFLLAETKKNWPGQQAPHCYLMPAQRSVLFYVCAVPWLRWLGVMEFQSLSSFQA